MVGVLPAPPLAQTYNTADGSVLLILDASGSIEHQATERRNPIAVAQRAIKGVAGFHPRPGAAIVADVRGAVGREPEELPKTRMSRRAFGPAGANNWRDRSNGRRW